MRSTPRHLTLRNVPAAVMRGLEKERRRTGGSLNQTAVDVLGRGLGINASGPTENGLAALAGTWTEADLKRFQADTILFEQVDDELWRG